MIVPHLVTLLSCGAVVRGSCVFPKLGASHLQIPEEDGVLVLTPDNFEDAVAQVSPVSPVDFQQACDRFSWRSDGLLPQSRRSGGTDWSSFFVSTLIYPDVPVVMTPDAELSLRCLPHLCRVELCISTAHDLGCLRHSKPSCCSRVHFEYSR